MKLEKIYSLLDSLFKGKVFYGTNIYDNQDNAKMPYIVYQEISRRPSLFFDDKPIRYTSNIQITLVSKKKDKELEEKLEKELSKNDICFSLLSETHNSDRSVNRVYQIKMEE